LASLSATVILEFYHKLAAAAHLTRNVHYGQAIIVQKLILKE